MRQQLRLFLHSSLQKYDRRVFPNYLHNLSGPVIFPDIYKNIKIVHSLKWCKSQKRAIKPLKSLCCYYVTVHNLQSFIQMKSYELLAVPC